MSRLKSIGFELDDLSANSEISEVSGNPTLITNINPNTNMATVWNDAEATWDSLEVPWPITEDSGIFVPEGVHGGYKSLLMHNGDVIKIPATITGGGGYFRVYTRFKNLPAHASNIVASFRRASDDKPMVQIQMAAGGILSLGYRKDVTPASTPATIVSSFSSKFQPDQWYSIELAIIGDQAGNAFHLEARVNGVAFSQADVTGISATDGSFSIGEANSLPGAYEMYVDDIAINDGRTTEDNTWNGEGKIVMLPVVADDEQAGTFTRGGTDTGSDWGQVADAAPPDDSKYLVGDTPGQSVDFRLGSPYEAGIASDDSINVVAANVRSGLSSAGDSHLEVYLRAGSNLVLEGNTILISGMPFFTSDHAGLHPDAFNTSHIPQKLGTPWTTDELSAARIGMEVIDNAADIKVSGLWVMVEYRPFGTDEYQVLVDGVDRTNDIINKSIEVDDMIFDQANTANFTMEDVHALGIPPKGVTVEIWINGVKRFGGLLTKRVFNEIAPDIDSADISCIDYTRLLDRRLVAATYDNMYDDDIINTIINDFAGDQGISTYHVSRGVLVSQISFNYVTVSQALESLSQITGRNWFIDYDKDIHYFPMTENRAPFELLNTGNEYQGLTITDDDSQLRNRVYVRGGTELTSDPITENQIADGVQTTFLLAEQPVNLSITVNGAPQTVGIQNIDDPTLFDFMMNFEQSYVANGEAAVLNPGDQIAFTYDYYVPVLVSVEDTNSVDDEGVYEYQITDNTIASTQAARDRAAAELTDYANSLIQGTYKTRLKGLRSGQYQRVVMPNKSIDEDYLVNKVIMKSLGRGVFEYTVSLTNARTFGIIRFLIEMLQITHTVGTVDPNAKVDGFFNITDQLDSLTDSLHIDSQGLGFPWSPDSLAPAGDLKWDLGQWS